MAGPLTGIRVVELASLAPAPFGCMILADLGAEVVQVLRAPKPGAITPPPGPLDRGRQRIALDINDAGDLARLMELVRHADVFVEGFRPGVAEARGVGPSALHAVNPGLIYARMTGWGQHGPLSSRAGHDINYIALAGALEAIGREGERPYPPLNLLGDFAGGSMFLVAGVLAALFERTTSGRGQVIDAAMVDGASLLMSFVQGLRDAGLWSGKRGTNTLDGGAYYYDTYECSDGGFVAVGCVEAQFRTAFLSGLGLEDPGLDFPGVADRATWNAFRNVVADRILTRTRDEWAATFEGSDACVTPVLAASEAPLHPHHVARNAFVNVDGEDQPAPAPRFSRSVAEHPAPPNDVDVEHILDRWSASALEEVAG
ncbi:MAG TPA: CaiB/BaiF CoA-transferase family protein [Marmoricola sp.]|nr:CaiB/BaiF CoA-transferase family protein [Marmoricola sp.]